MTIRTTAISAIIRPYSTIVAPSSSRTKRFNMTDLSGGNPAQVTTDALPTSALYCRSDDHLRSGNRATGRRGRVGGVGVGHAGVGPGERALKALTQSRDDHDQND